MADFTILGMGGFGLSLAVMLNNFGHNVTVWSAFEQEVEDIRRDGENKQKLPGVRISDEIRLTNDISLVNGADIVIFGIPTRKLREVAQKAAPHMSVNTVAVNTGKGLEDDTLKRMSEVLEEELPANQPIVVLSGPSHAEEVALGMPTTVVAASKDSKYSDYVQSVMSNNMFRIYINNDLVGCELGGSLKNVIALCAGICDGMGFGDNTKAALMTRGITEIARLGVALGGKTDTFAGLTGIGDLIVTCTSMHSRNRRAGILIGQGVTPQEAVDKVGTVEGYICTKAAYNLARKVGIDMPITEQCYRVLFEGLSAKAAVNNLMGRPKRHEAETVWVD
ncbi:MAG: NAD(P)H-dependent glycerol-3-phosphate dehydrogenase [Oscillospiraceae bacterium]|jgi:glycerol-3-phosphate dehydrogenase (NAD(P)+)|nr:NAD(P)H-dependent glycerol-3-phosphate dehydrogenase [Oscillospiraceae bacterium]